MIRFLVVPAEEALRTREEKRMSFFWLTLVDDFDPAGCTWFRAHRLWSCGCLLISLDLGVCSGSRLLSS